MDGRRQGGRTLLPAGVSSKTLLKTPQSAAPTFSRTRSRTSEPLRKQMRDM